MTPNGTLTHHDLILLSPPRGIKAVVREARGCAINLYLATRTMSAAHERGLTHDWAGRFTVPCATPACLLTCLGGFVAGITYAVTLLH
jgi:hypothetical protein